MFSKADIDSYFISMQHLYLFLLLLSAACIITAVIFFFVLKKEFLKGISIALASAAILFFSTAYSPYKKADRLRVVNVYNYDMHPEHLKGKELKRIATLKTTLQISIYLSGFLLITGAGLYIYVTKKLNHAYLCGLALGLFFMAGIAAISFYKMQKNTLRYEDGVRDFTKEIVV
jgi:hypothetical protein